MVTLDGVDPAMLSNSTLEYMDMDQESYITLDETPKAANIVRVAPQRIQTSTPIDFEFTDGTCNTLFFRKKAFGYFLTFLIFNHVYTGHRISVFSHTIYGIT